VHLGLVAMYFGFTGAAYDIEQEAALRPGESLEVRGVTVRYDGSRMEVDPGKRMMFSEMTVLEGDREIARIAPAKFIYAKPPGTATTEVAIRTTLSHDVYAIMNTVNPESKLGTFRVIVRPFVLWIWLGGLLMILGTAVCMAPSVREVLGESRASYRRPLGAAATAILLALPLALGVWTLVAPSVAHGQQDGSSSLHAGSVTMHNAEERQLFERLLCECGDCQRLPLSTCSCGWADDARARIRGDLAAGKSPLAIQNEYRDEFGPQAIAIPGDEGLDRALWAVPVAIIAFAAFWLVRLGRGWVRKTDTEAAPSEAAPSKKDAALDEALDRELARLDDGGPR